MGKQRPWHQYRQYRPSKVIGDSRLESVSAPDTPWHWNLKGRSRDVILGYWRRAITPLLPLATGDALTPAPASD